MNKETLIYGAKQGEPDYMEQLLYDGGQLLNSRQVDLIKTAAKRDGFAGIRVVTYKGGKPDFTKTINM